MPDLPSGRSVPDSLIARQARHGQHARATAQERQATGDPRCRDALAVLERRRRPDGRWQPGGYWWKPPGARHGTAEAVDWGRSAPSEMITLNALRVLRT